MYRDHQPIFPKVSDEIAYKAYKVDGDELHRPPVVACGLSEAVLWCHDMLTHLNPNDFYESVNVGFLERSVIFLSHVLVTSSTRN